MHKDNTLVSVCVITYNSAKYIIDTLESIKSQTYPNIELIISDDCSTDNTITMCNEWILSNEKRFYRCQIITAIRNTGISGNLNRGIMAAKGEWIKHMAGDDKLLPNSISGYMTYVQSNHCCRICFAKLFFWGEDGADTMKAKETYEERYYPFIRKDQKEQFKEILKRLYVPGPGLFFQKSLYEEVGGFDEKYPFCEEYPFTYNILEKGEQIYFINEELFAYQIRKDSLCRTNHTMDKRVFKDVYAYFKNERRWNMIKNGYFFHAIHQTISCYRQSLSYSHSEASLLFLGSNALYLLSPLTYLHIYKKCLKKFNHN